MDNQMAMEWAHPVIKVFAGSMRKNANVDIATAS
jgi:hypothetical protein